MEKLQNSYWQVIQLHEGHEVSMGDGVRRGNQYATMHEAVNYVEAQKWACWVIRYEQFSAPFGQKPRKHEKSNVVGYWHHGKRVRWYHPGGNLRAYKPKTYRKAMIPEHGCSENYYILAGA